MDLLRSSLKVLLYDSPLEPVAEHIIRGTYGNIGDFFDRTSELLQWREKGFSATETKALQGVLRSDWMVDEECGLSTSHHYHPYELIPVVINRCASEILDITSQLPRVKNNHLLRWRELTLLIGEDTLSIPLLARHDILHERSERDLLWPNVLGHDDLQINGILEECLSDTHFHLNAGCDVFEFNWIVAMNHPEAIIMDSEVDADSKTPGGRFLTDGAMREYDLVHRHSDINITLRGWMLVAADIRARLATILNEETLSLSDPLMQMSQEMLYGSSVMQKIPEIKALIDTLAIRAAETENRLVFDYAIKESSVSKLPDYSLDNRNVYLVHLGERELLYKFYSAYFGNSEWARRFAPQVYLYLLIRNKIRRELIQTNGLRGFRNFQLYQNFKSYFTKFRKSDGEKIQEIAYRYAIQSALGTQKQYCVEARITPGAIRATRHMDCMSPIFDISARDADKTFDIREKVSLVVHFLKRSEPDHTDIDCVPRHYNLRVQLQKDVRTVLEAWNDSNEYPSSPDIVGVDAASEELGCRPEVFAPAFRKLREEGINGITYHVGEDFYDVLDGLRAIDEAIKFLGLSSGNRIGHALALGTDAKDYYTKRHRYIVIPKQDLLDNLVWLKFRSMEFNIPLQPATELYIRKNFVKYRDELRYPAVDMALYHEAMMRRGEDPMVYTPDLKSVPDDKSANVSTVLERYWFSSETYNQGKVTISDRLPESYVDDVAEVQRKMFGVIEKKGIIIESNPTSNLMIGGFQRYIKLPLFKFHCVDDHGYKLPVSINTDDKGVFATSLPNEYSLIAVALRKERNSAGERLYSDQQIIRYLRSIAKYGNLSRFKKY